MNERCPLQCKSGTLSNACFGSRVAECISEPLYSLSFESKCF